MDITATSAECDFPNYTATRPIVLNFDGDPSVSTVEVELVAAVADHHYFDDESRATAHADTHLDLFTNEGVTTLHIEEAKFRFALKINPDIPRGGAVRISSPEAPHHGAFGVLTDASDKDDEWQVQLLDGRTETYRREHLADWSRHTTTDNAAGLSSVPVPAAFSIGEHALLTASRTASREDQVVQIIRRRYSHPLRGGTWLYVATPVDPETRSAHSTLNAREDELSKIPRAIQKHISHAVG